MTAKAETTNTTRMSRVKGAARNNDPELNWVAALYPEHQETLEPWVKAARSWFAAGNKPLSKTLKSLSNFIEYYLLHTLAPKGFSIDIKRFLSLAHSELDLVAAPDSMKSATRSKQASIGQKQIGTNPASPIPSLFEILAHRSRTEARHQNNKIHEFLNFILETHLNARQLDDGRLRTEEGLGNPMPYVDSDGRILLTKNFCRNTDPTLTWVGQQHPELGAWRVLAVNWLSKQKGDQDTRLNALSKFFTHYLARPDLKSAVDPRVALARSTRLPDFFDILVAGGKGIGNRMRKGGATTSNIIQNNYIADFIDWVLLSDENGYSAIDDHDRRQIAPAFHNFVTRRSLEGRTVAHDSSVRQALPYGVIHEAKKILIQGPNFKDWTWAQTLLGAQEGEWGRPGSDWFEVPEALVDPLDPDCVFKRKTLHSGRSVVKMWSPVRYVALAIKLMVPLRTMQVRVLDSGEADTWRFEPGRYGQLGDSGGWVLNTSKLSQGSQKRPLSCGVISRWEETYKGDIGTQLFINTNKTNDRDKGGAAKGYHTAWPQNLDPLEDVYYWIAKLRNWQQKYNPISSRTSWTELQGKGIIQEKDVGTLSSHSHTCFLFRAPEVVAHPHLPIKDSQMVNVWARLLKSLQEQLALQGMTQADGSAIQLVTSRTRSMLSKDLGKTYSVESLTPLFDLHGLRVSLITCLAWDGEVPFEILQKLVGHSRLLMTLYYYKPGQRQVQQVLQAAQERLNANAQASVVDWLRNGEHKELEKRAIAVNSETFRKLIPINPTHRNAAGWMEMADGVCLAGGNTSPEGVNAQTPGCYNGGPNIGNPTKAVHAEVPGGARNCPRCRWFVTEPHHLPALVARFNNTAFHFDQAGVEVAKRNKELEALRIRRADAEAAGSLFVEQSLLKSAERLLELHIKAFDERCNDLGAIWQLIKRAIDILNSEIDGNALILATDMTGLKVAIEEPEGELLQLAWVCENAEVFPDLNPGTAVLRRTQLLDLALEREGLPTVFMRLSPDEQKKVGNAFMRRLSERMNPDDRWIGMRKVAEHMEAGHSLIGLPGVQEALQAITGTSVNLTLRGTKLSLCMASKDTS